jgi:hypothetical protein
LLPRPSDDARCARAGAAAAGRTKVVVSLLPRQRPLKVLLRAARL